MNIYKKLLDLFIRLAKLLCIVMVCGIVLLMLNELVMRNIFDKSFRGMTELAGFFFLWMAFLGIPVLYDKNGLITLDILSAHAGQAAQRVFWFVQQVVTACLGVVMVIAFAGLYPFVVTEFYSSMPTFSKMWQFLPLAVCGVYLTLKAVYNILERICPRTGSGAESAA